MVPDPHDTAAPDQTPERDEIAEKASFWTSEAVNARLRSTFATEERGAAALLLADLAPAPDCGPEADEAACRLMLAALRASEGVLLKLKMWVEAGREDPRDLIAVAEYRGELVDGDESARNADLDSYLAWVSGVSIR